MKKTLHDELSEMMRQGTYCGSCKGACMVKSGTACCHRVVQYGHCDHAPLQSKSCRYCSGKLDGYVCVRCSAMQ